MQLFSSMTVHCDFVYQILKINILSIESLRLIKKIIIIKQQCARFNITRLRHMLWKIVV